MLLDWRICNGDIPCPLYQLNLNSISEKQGVYVIWIEEHDQFPIAVRVGQVWAPNRTFKERFEEHKADKGIERYSRDGELYVTWAEVNHRANLDGIERFLFDELNPLIGERAPLVEPIYVNVPPSLYI